MPLSIQHEGAGGAELRCRIRYCSVEYYVEYYVFQSLHVHMEISPSN